MRAIGASQLANEEINAMSRSSRHAAVAGAFLLLSSGAALAFNQQPETFGPRVMSQSRSVGAPNIKVAQGSEIPPPIHLKPSDQGTKGLNYGKPGDRGTKGLNYGKPGDRGTKGIIIQLKPSDQGTKGLNYGKPGDRGTKGIIIDNAKPGDNMLTTKRQGQTGIIDDDKLTTKQHGQGPSSLNFTRPGGLTGAPAGQSPRWPAK